MPTTVCMGSNSLPLDASKQPNRPPLTSNGMVARSVANSKPNGLNRHQNLSDRYVSNGTKTNGTNEMSHLSLSHPKLLRLEALNRSFHNAANLANELRDSLNSGLMMAGSNGGAASTSSLASSPIHKTALPPTSGSPNSTSAFVRHFSLKIKNHVQTSLSDPLKRKGSTRNSGRPVGRQNLNSPLIDDHGPLVMDSSSDEEDFEVRAQIEREEIVERYDRGPEDEENIRHAEEAWENPDFDLYNKTDRYGFIHQDNLREAQEKRDRERERQRCLKWDRMYREWEVRPPAKLADRIWKGVPDSYRLKVWRKMLAIDELIERNGSDIYPELLERGKLLSTEIKQIDLDVARTYRDHVMFMQRYNTSQQSIFNVLVAYSMYNTEIGYCQGMNNLVAILLMYLGDESAAFWGLHSLITSPKFSMHGFFIPGLPKLGRFEAHFNKVMKRYLPKLHDHMEREYIPQPYLSKWWFNIYVDRLPFSLAMRVWDVFLHVGDALLIAMAYNIMKMHLKDLVKAPLEVFMDVIQNRIAADFGYTNDRAMESLRKCLEKLQDDKMALPPRPKKGETPEFPVKALGPILHRSLADIRMDITELHSRSSRANSMAGSRSPAIKARRAVAQQQQLAQRTNTMSPQLASTPPTTLTNDFTSQSPLPPNGTRTPTTNPPPVRKTSVRNGRLPAGAPPIPDSEGFIPLASTRNRSSFYDNVTPSGGSVASSITGGIRHSRETSSSTARVHSTANNVTYVAVTDDDMAGGIAPDSPTPDYDDQEAPDFAAALRSQYNAIAAPPPSSYQPSGQFRRL